MIRKYVGLAALIALILGLTLPAAVIWLATGQLPGIVAMMTFGALAVIGVIALLRVIAAR